MARDEPKADQGRRRFLRDGYDLYYFKHKHGLSTTEAVRILNEARGSREKANSLAEQVKTAAKSQPTQNA